MKSLKPFPLCDDGIELPIKQMYCRGDIIADELQADGTLIKRTDTIEELNRRIKQMKEQEREREV